MSTVTKVWNIAVQLSERKQYDNIIVRNIHLSNFFVNPVDRYIIFYLGHTKIGFTLKIKAEPSCI